jgi:hypothetical protein
MNKIQKVSRYFLIIFNILLITLPLFITLQWLFINTSTMKNLLDQGILQTPISTPEGSINLSTIDWSWLPQIIGFVAQSIGLLPLLMSLFVLKSIFTNYQNGEIFSLFNARQYRRLGGLFILDSLIAQPINHLLIVLAVTLSNPPGHRYISLTFGTPNIKALFCGLLVIVISWVMVEASKLHDDQKFTI